VTAPGVLPAHFRQLLGRFAAGVTVLATTDARGRPVGMTASSVASVSIDPPLLLVGVSHASDMYPVLMDAGHFGLSVLADDQEALSRHFAQEEGDRFRGVAYRLSEHGVPVLDGVVATIECEKHSAVPGGDHTVFFGRVIGGSTSDRAPLVHYRGGYAGLARDRR
jgi:flavin reductase (DIM6/NTAB) family NADH-FMN oxidoreductase RutF